MALLSIYFLFILVFDFGMSGTSILNARVKRKRISGPNYFRVDLSFFRASVRNHLRFASEQKIIATNDQRWKMSWIPGKPSHHHISPIMTDAIFEAKVVNPENYIERKDHFYMQRDKTINVIFQFIFCSRDIFRFLFQNVFHIMHL